jgi:hypothetical protein
VVVPARRLPTTSVFLGVPLPIATSTRGIPILEPASRADPGPSSTFLTSSTVSSAACLAGLFHPTATSGIRSPRASPRRTAVRPRRSPMPSCRFDACAPSPPGPCSMRRMRCESTRFRW